MVNVMKGILVEWCVSLYCPFKNKLNVFLFVIRIKQ